MHLGLFEIKVFVECCGTEYCGDCENALSADTGEYYIRFHVFPVFLCSLLDYFLDA